jgi:hypothetical protein
MSVVFPITRRSMALLFFVATLSFTACTDSPGAPPPHGSLPPLAAGAWYMHSADGQSLPAMVAHRLVDGVLEQTFIDSSRLEINSNGTWQQAVFKRRVLIGLPAMSDTSGTGPAASRRSKTSVSTPTGGDVLEPVLHTGLWTATDSAYRFVADVGAREFVVRAPAADSFAAYQKLVEFEQSGLVRGVFRRTPPLVPLSGTWRAISAASSALPALVEYVPRIEDDGQEYSIHVFVDSSRLELQANGEYQHKLYASSWQGPANGGPTMRVGIHVHNDRGVWSRPSGAALLQSAIYEAHAMSGELLAGGPLRLVHGVGPAADVVFEVVYGRME